MILNRTFNLVPAGLIAVLIAACAGSPPPETEVDRVARATDLAAAPYKRVMIVGVMPRGSTAREFEEELAESLSNDHTYAFGYRRAAQRGSVDEDTVRRLVADRRADAVIVITEQIVDTDVKVTGEHAAGMDADVIGGGLFDFFRYDYQEYITPSETDLTFKVRMVTELYDVASEQKVYVVESTTDHAETSIDVISSETKSLTRRLRKDKMVR